jgi:hypothetical protein
MPSRKFHRYFTSSLLRYKSVISLKAMNKTLKIKKETVAKAPLLRVENYLKMCRFS